MGLPGFTISAHFNEQIREYTFDPQVRVHINAPARTILDPGKPTTLVIYALPNGNTIEQTIGRRPGPGVDWHYGIQHIGAQVRRLRETVPVQNLVIGYVEAAGKSWPAWKTRHTDYIKIIPALVESICEQLKGGRPVVVLSGHSGGGSFIFGYIDAFDRIPDQVSRIAFLDSDYGYSDEKRHGDKLVEWLKRDRGRYLSVLCYDDRNVILNGKPIVGPDGGTYRKTLRMIDRLRKDMELKEMPGEAFTRYRGLDGRVDLILHHNPKGAILHTALVGDMSGFIHSLTSGTPYENVAGRFKAPVSYDKWIQED